MEYIAGMTTRGRVTIPKAMRDELSWKPADKIHFTVQDGEVKLEKVLPPPPDTTCNAIEGDAGNATGMDFRRLEP